MTRIKSLPDDDIALPAWLMAALNLREGDQVKLLVEGRVLHLVPLDSFLALCGTLRDDESFDAAISFLERRWLSWTVPGIDVEGDGI